MEKQNNEIVENIKKYFSDTLNSTKKSLNDFVENTKKSFKNIISIPGKIGNLVKFIKENPKENSKVVLNDTKKYIKKKTNLRNNNNWFELLGKLCMYAILIVISYIFLSPIIEMVSKSFMSMKDLVNPEVFYVPTELTFTNFSYAIEQMNFVTSFFRSVWFSGLLAILQVVISALTAYAFARYNFKGKNIWFVVLILVFILPTPILITSRKILFENLQSFIGIQMMGSTMPIIIMTLFGQGVYSTILILIFYNFFKQIPYDLDEAAYMDGASSFGVFYHVILKLSMPIMFTVFLFSFVWNWNESLQTSIFFSKDFITLPISLVNLGATSQSNEGYKMAGTILSILPLILLYLGVQRKFIEGIEQTGITGV